MSFFKEICSLFCSPKQKLAERGDIRFYLNQDPKEIARLEKEIVKS